MYNENVKGLIETTDDLVAFHRDVCGESAELMRKKNQDYAGGDSTVFGNLDMCERMGWFPCEIGILLRLMDKLARLGSLILKGRASVVGESIQDNCKDGVNYNVLILAKQHNRKIQDSGEVEVQGHPDHILEFIKEHRAEIMEQLELDTPSASG